MTRTIALLIFTALVVLPHTVSTQGQAPGRGRGAGANLGAVPADAPPPRSTPPGPHAVTVESYPTLATQTAYHPTNLDAFEASNLLPIVSWGNGACVRNGTAFLGFLTQIASHDAWLTCGEESCRD